MSLPPRIFADFNNADPQGRVRLNCVGTVQDLSRQQVQLQEGIELLLYCDDGNENGQEVQLIADGTVAYSQAEQGWVAVIDWQKIRHESTASPGVMPIDTHGAVLPGNASHSPSARPASR